MALSIGADGGLGPFPQQATIVDSSAVDHHNSGFPEVVQSMISWIIHTVL